MIHLMGGDLQTLRAKLGRAAAQLRYLPAALGLVWTARPHLDRRLGGAAGAAGDSARRDRLSQPCGGR
jgi:hypothetical protein